MHDTDTLPADCFYRATEGTGHSGGFVRQEGKEVLYIGEDGTYRFNSDRTSYTPRSRQSRTPPILNLRGAYNISAPADLWDDSFEPESPPPLASPGFDDSFADDLINARTEFDIKSSQSSEKDSGNYSDSEYSSTDVSVAQPANSGVTNRLREISATVFQSTASVPITIIVTTPLEEIPDPVTNPPVLQRNSARFPLATLSSDHFNDVNPSLLMPPTDNQLDPRKLRKAQEFREIRKWLITFLNSKGDRFPRKLRLRMMDLYCIREFDLAPGIVAKFNAEVQDEGVDLEQQDEGMDDAKSLSILGAAFRSQIEEVTPKKEKVGPLPVPPSPQRHGSPPKKLEKKKPESIKPKKESRPATPVKEEMDMDLVPSWLGPLISTSTSSRDSLLSNEQYLKKAYSAPNLKGSRPHLTSTDSTHSVPGLRPRGSTVAGEDARRKQFGNKRGSFISGAFGAMKDAMRRPSKRDVQKKKSWDDR